MRFLKGNTIADPFLPSGGMGWLLTITSTVLMFLIVVAVFLSSVALQVSNRWSVQLVNTAVIQLPLVSDGEAERLLNAVDIVLSRTPGVEGYALLDDATVRADLAEWLGDVPQDDLLPLPRLIQLRLGPASLDTVALQSQLDAVAPGAIFDDYNEWRGPLSGSVLAIRILAFGSVALLVFALAVLIWLTIRSALAANGKVIEIVSQLGANERFIRRGLTRRYLGLVALGALIGSTVAMIGIYLLPTPADDGALLSDFTPTLAEWAAITAVPLAIILLAYSIIRQTIGEAFSKTP